MPIDPYSPCPGGTGKKVKFCCADLVGELEKIGRMLEGKQQQACLDHIERLEARFPGRACLMTTKALLQHGLGQESQARETTQKVLASNPENPIALAEAAIFGISETGALAAVEPLQRAIAASGSTIDSKVFEAIGIVAVSLLNEGHIAAALAHATLLTRIVPDYSLSANLLVSVMQNPGVPLPMKDLPQPLSPAPGDAPWKAQFDDALGAGAKAQWLRAAERFEAIAAGAPDAAPVWRNLALMRAYLADEARSAAALRHYAKLDVPFDDAADALVLAHFLDSENVRTLVDLVSIPYPIADQERLAARLASDRRVVKLPIDGVDWGGADGPPPRSAHLLLDKPLAQTGVGLAVESVSEVLGRMFVYGRETDREARLELVVHRDQFATAAEALAQVTGDTLRSAEAEEVLGSIPLLQHTLGASSHLPDDTPPDDVRRVAVERRRKLLTEKWTTTANDLLDGRTPAEAAAEGAQRANLLAALRVVEFSLADPLSGDESTAMRERLGLPPDEPIDPAQTPLGSLGLTRLARLQVEKLSDDDLQHAYRRAAFARIKPALVKLVDELLARPSLEGKVDKAQALGVLAATESDGGKALELIGKARTLAEAAGQSSAPWDLEELDLLLAHGEGEAAMRLINHLQSKHRGEAGVMERLLQILYDAGLVDEHGRPIQRQRAEPAGLVVPGAAAEPGKLWTPDGETGSGKKAALWTPGME
jgi:tetratricopeptide (TPR) repeat protein